jgi:hypothetical protein
MMKKVWHMPSLVEYGRMGRLTRGQHGTQSDYNVNGGVFANDSCDPTNSGPGNSGNSSPFVCGAAAS